MSTLERVLECCTIKMARRIQQRRMTKCVFYIVALLGVVACGNPLDNAPSQRLQSAASLPQGHDRVILQLLVPAITATTQWRLRVIALYAPLDTSEPGATVTTSSYANCRQPATVVWVPSLNLTPCERTLTRSHEVTLANRQLRVAGEQGFSIDFTQQVVDSDARFGIDKLFVELAPCESVCDVIRQEVDITCWDEERTDEIFSNQFHIAYLRNADPAQAKTCGLMKGDWAGWVTRDVIMQRVRGHYGEADEMISDDLLDDFPVVPKREHGWWPNRFYQYDTFQSFCKPENNVGGYDRARTVARLSKDMGWPHDENVEIYVYRLESGELCALWLESYAGEGNYTSGTRIDYEFDRGRLMQIRTDEPNDLQRRWRYLEGQPYEYLRKQDTDSVSGGEDILYWHRDAATEWPERMDYTPDFKEFAEQARVAEALAKAYGTLKNAPAAASD